ncbi:MAG: EAL domain-containing protein [Pseudomonadota bacterium]
MEAMRIALPPAWRRQLVANLAHPPANPIALALYTLVAALLTFTPLMGMNALLHTELDQEAYVATHTLLETINTALALMVFMLAWSARHGEIKLHFKITGLLFAGIAILNTAHLLTFPGMPGVDPQVGMQRTLTFGMAFQFMIVAALLSSAWLSGHECVDRPRPVILTLGAGLFLAASILWIEFYRPLWMPVWWSSEGGLTNTKRSLEIAIAAAYLFIAFLLGKRATRYAGSHEHRSYVMLLWASLAMGASGFAFTAYGSSNELVALLGHLYRGLGFLLIYYALFEKGVHLPYLRLAQSERRLEESRERYKTLFQSTPDGVLLVDRGGVIRNANPSLLNMFGHTRESLIGHSVDELLPHRLKKAHAALRHGYTSSSPLRPREMGQGLDLMAMRRDGTEFPVEVALVPLEEYANKDITIMCIVRDVTERKKLELRLLHDATHDALTGLPNRALFVDRLQEAKARAERDGGLVAVMFLDLDHFKKVNDSLGHAEGDRLLKQAAQRLRETLGADDIVARVGGDEFTILLQDLVNSTAAAKIAEKVIRTLTSPFRLGGREVFVGASIGITFFPDDASDTEDLFRNADIALYAAKDGGRNTFSFFSSEMDHLARERLSLEQSLRAAVTALSGTTREGHPRMDSTASNALQLYYQPQVRPDGSLVGAEALLRWQHEGSFIPPDRFIVIAEETGMIVPIGAWVLRTACRQARAWDDKGLKLTRMAVNVSSRQFRQHDFASQVKAVLDETGWPASRLELEITESIIMDAPEQAAIVLQELREIGVHIAVDDFGTGYSSLAYLKLFHVDQLKIDRSFTRDLPDDADDSAIVNAVISMARALGLSVVAEGVETEAQREWLTRHGCHVLQGWLFGKAVPPEAFEKAMQRDEIEAE